jgi:hypothetical protein
MPITTNYFFSYKNVLLVMRLINQRSNVMSEVDKFDERLKLAFLENKRKPWIQIYSDGSISAG